MERAVAASLSCIEEGFELILHLPTAGIPDSQHPSPQSMSACLYLSHVGITQYIVWPSVHTKDLVGLQCTLSECVPSVWTPF